MLSIFQSKFPLTPSKCIKLSHFFKFSLRLLIVVWSFLFLITPSFGQSSEKKLVKVQITGIRVVDGEALITSLESQPSTEFSSSNIQKDLKTLYATGFFEDIQVQREELPDGYELTFLVKEKPVVVGIQFEGNKAVTEKNLKEDFPLQLHTIVNDKIIKEAEEDVKKKYLDRGYYLAEVSATINQLSDYEVSVTFNVVENEKVKIEEINIIGNEGLSAFIIKRSLESRERFWAAPILCTMKFWQGCGNYKPEQVQEDLERIREIYKNYGYINILVHEPEVVYNEDQKRIFINIKVEEGARYRVGEINLSGNEVYETSLLSKSLKTKSGKFYSEKQLQEDLTNLSDIYGIKGYIDAYISKNLKPHTEDSVVDIDLKIREGDQYRLNRLMFVGNRRTKDKVIRREFPLPEQAIFNVLLFRRGLEKVHYLGYFDELEPKVKPNPTDKTVDVEVKVKEAGKRQLEIAGGYGSYDKLFGILSLSDPNLFGTGRTLKLSATVGSKRQFYDISFEEPYLFDTLTFGSVEAYRRRIIYSLYTKRATGGTVSLGRPLFEHVRIYTGYRYERVKVYDSESDYILEGSSDTSSVSFTLARDTRDSRWNPTKGTFNRYYFQVAGGILGGDNTFYKHSFDTGLLYKLFEHLVFHFHGQIEYGDSWSGNTFPTFERFYMGGENSVRGFKLRSIGPEDENGDEMGGNKTLLFNFEFIVPIAEPFSIVLFHDQGDCWTEKEEYDLSTLRKSAGVEFRFTIPAMLLPLRFILGYNLEPEPHEDRSDFQFTIGTAFY